MPFLLLCLVLSGPSRGDIVINEISAGASDRLLQWDGVGAAATPRLGSGTPWQQPAFNDASWPSGPGPFGFGTTSPTTPAVGTNVANQMQYLTPTLYLRRAFNGTEADAARVEQLQLAVEYNDGFICYVNGVEVVRRWAGPTRQFHYHDQPAYNPNLANTTNPTNLYQESINLGAANLRLLPGNNVIAIHALNFSASSPNLMLKATLQISGSPVVPLVAPTDVWKYFPGVVEPSGALYDPALLSSGKLNVPWGRAAFDVAMWSSGPGPIGAGVASAGTNVAGVIGQTPSLFMRTVFTATAAQVAQMTPMQLLVDFDDGFVAYINGVEVARANLGNPNTFTPSTAVATATRNLGSQTLYAIDTPARLLVPGQNVLSIQAHNVSINDSDLYAKVDLRLNGGVTMVPNNATWKYFVGTDEPVPADDGATDESPEGPEAATDWVELHNNGATAVSLNGWTLTDDAGSPNQWVFPDVTIPAGGYLIVVCDGLDLKDNPGGFLHTNFKLDADGEYLALLNANGQVVQQFAQRLPRASAFHSYGRNASGAYVYSATPTPGTANTGPELTGFVASPVPSIAGGFYATTQSLSLSCATPGATIRFTIDGSEPTESTGTLYSNAITIGSSIAVRARAFKADLIPSPTVTNTYLLLSAQDTKRSLPAMCLTADPTRSLYRPFGIFAITNNDPTNNYSGDVWNAQNSPLQYHNPSLRGRFIERPANMQVSYPSGAPGFNIDFGLRCSGSGYSRPRYKFSWLNQANPNVNVWSANATEKPQMNVFFRDDLGGKPLEFPLFPGSAVTSFENLRLRAGKNDISNPWVRDELMRRLFIDVGQKGSHGINTTMWINGVYKGFFNVTERLREDFFQRWYGSDLPWDVWVVNDTASGDSLSLQEMLTYLRTHPQNVLANYRGAEERIDMVNFVDYMIVNLYGCTGDWPHNNYTMARERSANGKWVCALWDGEGSFGTFGGLTVRSNQFTPAGANTTVQGGIVGSGASSASEGLQYTLRTMYTLLRASPEFKLLFADRVQKHFFNGGALTDANITARKNALRTEMTPLIPGFADAGFNNWINGVGNPTRYTVTGASNSPSRRNVLLNGYIDDSLGGVTMPAQFVTEGLWPVTAAPSFSQHGGAVPANYNLTITNPNGAGTIYFTTDGSDPRGEGGAPQGTAYTGPIPVAQTMTVQARVRNSNNEWSPLLGATFITSQAVTLLITEVMYHPPTQGAVSGEELEFIELKNTGTAPVNLNGMQFTDGVAFTFPAGSTVAPGAFAVLVKNATQFAARYPGLPIAGTYGPGSSLANDGELLTLRDLAGNAVFSVNFDDESPWPALADGYGSSIVPVNPNSNPAPNTPTNWRASTSAGGSPGVDDPVQTIAPVIVNEVLSNPIAPQTDSIELWNPNAQAVDIGGWFLSDAAATPKKFRIPTGTVLNAGGYRVFTEADFNTTPSVGSAFELDAHGEEVRLSSADLGGTLTGYGHGFSFGASEAGVSFGRHLTSAGTEVFPAQKAQTPGAANAGALVGPIVFTELMYDPSGNSTDEFAELRNISTSSVPLFDPANPSNTWRITGIGTIPAEWPLPAGITLGARQHLILTRLDPVAARSKYAIPAAIPVFQYPGALSNDGELLALQKPGIPYTDPVNGMVVPFIDVDVVDYKDVAPWPVAPGGAGPSLERISPLAFGNDPANWRASASAGGNAGAPPMMTLAAWQSIYFTPAQIADANVGAASADPDHDGLTNFREFAHGLDPLAADSSAPISTAVEDDGTGSKFLTLRYRRNVSAQGLQYFADTAGELPTWTAGGAVQAGTPINEGDGTATVIMRDSVPTTDAVKRFIRLRIIGP